MKLGGNKKMIRTMQRLIITGILSALLMTGCATTQLTSAWKDPAYKGPPHKIMIVGITKKPVNKRIFEDEFVRQLKAKGIDAVASYTVMADRKQGDHEVIAMKLKEQGADAVLITRLVSKKTVRTDIPGRFTVIPSSYGTWRDYYVYGSEVIFTPGYTAEDEYALMESNLYDAGSDKLIWSAASETELLGSDQDQIKSYIGVMVNSMAGQKLLK